ncbi:glycosyltransferase family 4 protein [Nocardioides donggukensis]|uniref:Glycosyltransferase family 4 protein n=1 Tax=Nocardioides donggukensis TaxID=2774019 RepID=A0A927PZS6_9ACTN|nr:glycosyltransferase family 4 protein [Nocardioides donggukensis]MBD8869685.1 glycosyltransferase family 4 protein [Nocardioides donggukensis]
MQHPTRFDGRHVVFFSWRDTRNPEGGGAELYLEKIAAGLVERGARVTVFCAAHAGAPPDEVVDGIRFVRRGSKMGVYGRGLLALARRAFGRVDAVVDVQNGLPFFTRLLTRKPVVVLVHHVHREQWPVVYPGLTGRVGWWIESRLAPRLYARCQYVAVSQATADELVGLGVDRDRIAIVHNGTDPALPTTAVRRTAPAVCTVGRLVPHKQVEHAIDACARLGPEFPGLRLTVAGSGWWDQELRQHARATTPEGAVTFEGHVSERRKQEIYAESWVMALPSLKEGWGLVVGEAGMHGTPTVAYRSAGGTRESIEHGDSGLLVDDFEEFVAGLRSLLADERLRERLSVGARSMSHRFTWGHAQGSFAHVLSVAMAGSSEHSEDPDET